MCLSRCLTSALLALVLYTSAVIAQSGTEGIVVDIAAKDCITSGGNAVDPVVMTCPYLADVVCPNYTTWTLPDGGQFTAKYCPGADHRLQDCPSVNFTVTELNPEGPYPNNATNDCKIMGYVDSNIWFYHGPQDLRGYNTFCVRAANSFPWGTNSNINHTASLRLVLDDPTEGDIVSEVFVDGSGWDSDLIQRFECYRSFCAPIDTAMIDRITRTEGDAAWPRDVYFVPTLGSGYYEEERDLFNINYYTLTTITDQDALVAAGVIKPAGGICPDGRLDTF